MSTVLSLKISPQCFSLLLVVMMAVGSLGITCSNYGLLFSGVNGFQTDSSASLWYALQEFTLEFWVMIDDYAAVPQGVVQAFVVQGVTSCDVAGYGFYRYNRTLYFIMGGTDICDDNSMAYDVPVGIWTHIAVAVSEGDVVLYVDGELYDQRTKSSMISYDNAPLKVGLGPDPDSGFLGELDEIRLWNIVRSANQVKSNYRVSLKNIHSSLLAYWRFEEGSDTEVKDSSSYNRQTLVSDTLDYTSNCMVASCLCNIAEYCVPGHDRTNEAAECPFTSSSTTKTISSSTQPTDNTISSSSPITAASTSDSETTSSSPVPSNSEDTYPTDESISVESNSRRMALVLSSVLLLGLM